MQRRWRSASCRVHVSRHRSLPSPRYLKSPQCPRCPRNKHLLLFFYTIMLCSYTFSSILPRTDTLYTITRGDEDLDFLLSELVLLLFLSPSPIIVVLIPLFLYVIMRLILCIHCMRLHLAGHFQCQFG